ncbi:MAG: hypothetical protein HKN31_06120, partial [Pricia sp.]|nr:hypothetical protein [Pricia sp.]
MSRLTSCNASGPNFLSSFFERVLGLNSIGIVILSSALFLIGCGSDDPVTAVDVDSDGDGILDEQEILNGTNKNNPCDPKPISGYMGFDSNNTVWLNADCDVDGISNAQELADNTDPFVNETRDTDGDGIPDFQETANGTDKDNPCDP